VISSVNKKQPLVVVSTTKAKYKATIGATREVMWLHRILSDLKLPQMQPTTLHYDNQSAMKITKNLIYHSKKKHVKIQHHYIKKQVQNKEIELIYCKSCYRTVCRWERG
jgi:hypothetical protein